MSNRNPHVYYRKGVDVLAKYVGLSKKYKSEVTTYYWVYLPEVTPDGKEIWKVKRFFTDDKEILVPLVKYYNYETHLSKLPEIPFDRFLELLHV